MIHTSTESHYEIALACLNENIAVFIDKPISYDLKQVESLLNISEKKNIPFMVGFNRRHAPLYQPFYETPPTHVRYQKNRVNLPGPASSVVFDDLIHILDFACSIGGLPSQSNICVYHSKVRDQLALVDIHWEQGGAIYSLSMNRMSGREEECLEVCRTNEKWVISNLTEGTYSLDGKTTILPESNWESTLHRRGFVHMIGKFLERVAAQQCDSSLNNDAWETHFLCQTVLEKI
jgi:virulence factor